MRLQEDIMPKAFWPTAEEEASMSVGAMLPHLLPVVGGDAKLERLLLRGHSIIIILVLLPFLLSLLLLGFVFILDLILLELRPRDAPFFEQPEVVFDRLMSSFTLRSDIRTSR